MGYSIGEDMPVFDIKCKDCNEVVETYVGQHKNVPKICKKCGGKNTFIKLGKTSWHFAREYTGRVGRKSL